VASPAADFSQDGEQAAILDWAAGYPGSFLEVGAYDGVNFSNTRALMLQGWSGVAVEPAPDMCDRLREAVDGYPVEVVQAACVAGYSTHRRAPLNWTPGQPFSSLTRTGDVKHQQVEVDEISVTDLLDRWTQPPRASGDPPQWLLSLDTEGTTLGLLAIFLHELRHAPGRICVVVEAHLNVADERPVAVAQLEHHGFTLRFCNPVNVIASRGKLD
jgi:FkbM family methyltransferase